MIRLLWIPMALYAAGVVHRAYTELTDEYVIQGLFRVYQPPREVPEGWLIDARPGDLVAELKARYQVGEAPAALGSDWPNLLKSLGIQTHATTGPGPTPRLLLVPGGPWLQTGTFQGQPTVFDPQRGVILLADAALAPETPALELVGLIERPW